MISHRPTIHDVAARAGVSKSLASRALRGDGHVSAMREEAIWRAARELGYRPNVAARNLAETRSRTLGIVLLDPHNPIAADLLDQIQSEIFRNGWHVMIVTGRTDPGEEAAELAKLIDFRVEGLMVIGHRLPEGFTRLTEHCPGVVVGSHHTAQEHVGSVTNDDRLGATLATEYLISLGHRHVAHLTGGSNAVALTRQQAFIDAMSAHRLKSLATCRPAGFDIQAGYDAARASMSRRVRPTALFVANDYAAVGALAAAMDLGIEVPRELSVIGYDGVAMGALRPFSLTTIAQPLTEMARAGVGMLVTDGERSAGPLLHVKLAPRLVVRDSVGPAPV